MTVAASTKLQEKLHRDLGQYYGEAPLKPPSTAYSHECHKKLSPELVRDGVVVLASYLGTSGSSGSDFDLYKLNMAYLLDPEIRATFNALMKDWYPPTRH